MMTLAGCGLAFELPGGAVDPRLDWADFQPRHAQVQPLRHCLGCGSGRRAHASTDPFTQCLLAAPIFLLYNISILVVWLIERARRRRDEALDRGEPFPSG